MLSQDQTEQKKQNIQKQDEIVPFSDALTMLDRFDYKGVIKNFRPCQNWDGLRTGRFLERPKSGRSDFGALLYLDSLTPDSSSLGSVS